jgi:4-amino-4-deoxy-L-arabinose transferase-like glycosyltransferase
LQPSTLAKRAWLLLFLAVVAFYLFGLGRLPLVGPDEPRYAQVAREMFLRHDLITPTLGGRPWFEKPALLYWMMIGSFRAFGVSEWAARLGPALSGLLTLAAVYWISRRVARQGAGDRKNAGNLVTLVLASSAGLIIFSKAASFDIIVTLTITWALALFLGAEIDDDGKHQRWFLVGFYCFVGLSLLAKGLVGIVIPFGVVFVYYALRRRLPRRNLSISLIWGVPLALLVATIWYGPVIARNGWPFIDQFFIQHHFARYLSNKYRHPQPFYFYLLIIILFTLPWTLFLADALVAARRWQWRADDADNRSRVFMLAWLFVPIIFFSFSGSKLAGYILPALPAAAFLAGERLERLVRESMLAKWPMPATGALLLCFAVGICIYAQRSESVPLPSVLLIVAPLGLAGLLALFWTGRRQAVAIVVGLSVFAATDLVLLSVADKLAGRESARDLIQLADARGYGSAPVFALRRIDRTVEFYAAGRVAYGPDGEPIKFETAADVAARARLIHGDMLVILLVGRVPQLVGYPGIQTTVIGNNGDVALIAVRAE